MILNPELLKVIEDSNLGEEAIYYCFAINFGLSLDVFFENIISDDNEHLYRINITDKDIVTNTLTLKYPLFVNKDDGLFETFLNGLIENKVRTDRLTKNSDTKEAFNKLIVKLNPDIEKLIKATTEYYTNTEMPKGLFNYLDQVAEIQYKSYTSKKTYTNLL